MWKKLKKKFGNITKIFVEFKKNLANLRENPFEIARKFWNDSEEIVRNIF